MVNGPKSKSLRHCPDKKMHAEMGDDRAAYAKAMSVSGHCTQGHVIRAYFNMRDAGFTYTARALLTMLDQSLVQDDHDLNGRNKQE